MEEQRSKLSFPVTLSELPKFFITAIMLMMTVYIYSILRASKDAIVVVQMGAELISVIKLYGVLPSAIIFMLIYVKLVDLFSRINLYHVLTAFFIGFFIIFNYILFPNAKALQIDVSGLIDVMPFLKYLFIMISHWPYTLFYIFSELWGTIMLSLMFWQLANQICTITEAQRFYPLFGLLGQIGLVAAGILGKMFSGISESATGEMVAPPEEMWQHALNSITLSVVVSGAILSSCLWYLGRIVGNDTINTTKTKSGKKKVKMGFGESIKYIMSSKYIGLITALILCYGISINLVEGVWKKSLSIQFPDSAQYSNFMGDIQVWTGIATAIAMLCGSFLLRIISWRTAAILTPIMILVTGIIFFLFMIFKTDLEPTVIAFGATAMAVAVFSGAAQNVLSKATKYAFFDPTKEMSYIPLDDDLKAKGKAAADVIGGRLGKSGGAFIQSTMLMLIPGANLISLAPNLFVIFVVIMLVWVVAVFALAKEFAIKTAEASEEVTSSSMETDTSTEINAK